MFAPEQIQAALAVVESQRAAATEAAINLSMRCTSLERQLKEANDKIRELSAPPNE